jgi:hypothetical protein
MTAKPRWEELAIQRDRQIVFFGDVWRHWGIRRDSAGGDYVVTHLPSLRRLTQFARKSHARRWCEAIDRLTDWSRVPPESERERLGPQMHREALRVTGSPPALPLIAGRRQ